MEEEQMSKAVEEILVKMKWRLKYRSKRRLLTDVLGLCTGMRPVVMVDYGGMMPQLQHHLCSLLHLCQQVCLPYSDSIGIKAVRVPESDGYRGHDIFGSHSRTCKVCPVELQFGARIVLCQLGTGSSADCEMAACAANGESSAGSSEFVDLSSCMQETEVTIPTLNGWLLGYPVVYLFSKKHIEFAIYNLSAKSLSIFRILVCRGANTDRVSEPEELMSFSVPYELSMRGSNEPWAEAFLAQMQAKWDKSRQVWSSLKMEVCECHPHAIAL